MREDTIILMRELQEKVDAQYAIYWYLMCVVLSKTCSRRN